MCLSIFRVHFKKKKKKEKKKISEGLIKLCLHDCVFFSSDFLFKCICCGYSFELHQQVDAIQMGTHNICLYKRNKCRQKHTGSDLKMMELLDWVLMGYMYVQ